MIYECAPSRLTPDEWVVEAIDHESEGEVYAALFSGPGAKERAEEYATWKNAAYVASGLRKAIVDGVRDAAVNLAGVTAAFVSPIGTEFLLTGPVWTVDMSSAAAALAVSLQDQHAPDGAEYIFGGFLENAVSPDNTWEQVLP